MKNGGSQEELDMKKLTVLVILIFLAGCASTWKQAGGRYESSSHNFVVEIPQGWMELNSTDFLLISKDGPFLQYMFAQRRQVNQPFQHSKTKMKKGMMPEEAAKVLLNEITSDQSLYGLEVTEQSQVEIAGHQGFRIQFSNENLTGPRIKTVYYGFLDGEWFYNIRYSAAERYYFDKDLETFDNFVRNFRLLRT
jgi:hypothetical protein